MYFFDPRENAHSAYSVLGYDCGLYFFDPCENAHTAYSVLGYDCGLCNFLCSLLGVENVAEVVRRGRLRWFGHVECKSGDDWVSACRNVVVAGVRCAGRGRKSGENV